MKRSRHKKASDCFVRESKTKAASLARSIGLRDRGRKRAGMENEKGRRRRPLSLVHAPFGAGFLALDHLVDADHGRSLGGGVPAGAVGEEEPVRGLCHVQIEIEPLPADLLPGRGRELDVAALQEFPVRIGEDPRR